MILIRELVDWLVQICPLPNHSSSFNQLFQKRYQLMRAYWGRSFFKKKRFLMVEAGGRYIESWTNIFFDFDWLVYNTSSFCGWWWTQSIQLNLLDLFVKIEFNVSASSSEWSDQFKINHLSNQILPSLSTCWSHKRLLLI